MKDVQCYEPFGGIAHKNHDFSFLKVCIRNISTYKVYDITPDTHEHQIYPQVKLADHVLPLENKPKVLGVTLETHLTFTQHCNNIAVKVQQRNNVLKSLVGSTWGCEKETLLTTCQAIGRSILS